MLLSKMHIFGFLILLGCSSGEKIDLSRSENPEVIRSSLSEYAKVHLSIEELDLSDSQLGVLQSLVKAAGAMDDIFWMQSYSKSRKIRERLQQSTREIDKEYALFLDINYGPFDRQHNNMPFIGLEEKPPGAGFYPEDMTREEFEHFVGSNAERSEEFRKFNTLIRRQEDQLVAVRFETEYQGILVQAAAHLRNAAQTTSDTLFRDYLNLRAEALLSGDYFQSDMAWMNLRDNHLDIVIGPLERSEDRLMGLKRAYQGIVLVRDWRATEQLASFLRSMDELEARLPVPGVYKKPFVPKKTHVGIFNSVYLSGAANAGTKSISLSLPDDERVRELNGLRNIQQKNVILAKFNEILLPIAREVMMEQLQPYATGEAFLTHKILHELAHTLGLKYVKDKNGVTVRKALGETYLTIEETKADVLALYNVRYFIQRGVLSRDFEQKAYLTFLAAIFRSARFGLSGAQARAGMIVLNHLRKEQALFFDPSSQRFGLNVKLMRNAIKKLAADLLIIEGDGNDKAADLLIKEMCNIPADAKLCFSRLSEIPIDLTFSFDPRLF